MYKRNVEGLSASYDCCPKEIEIIWIYPKEKTKHLTISRLQNKNLDLFSIGSPSQNILYSFYFASVTISLPCFLFSYDTYYQLTCHQFVYCMSPIPLECKFFKNRKCSSFCLHQTACGNLSSLTRDGTQAPLQWKHGVLTSELPGKPPRIASFYSHCCILKYGSCPVHRGISEWVNLIKYLSKGIW